MERPLTTRIPIRAVVFDYGKVLSRDQNADGVERLKELTRLSAEELERRYRHGRLDYDRGIVTSSQYWSSVLGSAEAVAPELVDALVQTDVESWLELDEDILSWAEELRTSGVPLAVLSNMPFDVLRGLRRKHDALLSTFSVTVFSCDLNSVKPEPRIYHELLQRLGLPGSDVLFIDDIEVNVRAAIDVGLHSVQFESVPKLLQDVSDRFTLVGANSRHQGG